MTEIWKLLGYDTFEEGFYPLSGQYHDEESAYAAAVARLDSIEEIQPTEESGGQAIDENDPRGIQDQIFVVRPDGSRYRVLPKELQDEL